MKTLQDALNYLNPEDDAQWTGNGLPLVEAVNAIWTEQVTRKQITEAAPNFNREVLREEKAPAEINMTVNEGDTIVIDPAHQPNEIVISLVDGEDQPQVIAIEGSGDEAGEAEPQDDDPEADVLVLTPYEEALAIEKESEDVMNVLTRELEALKQKVRNHQVRHLRIVVRRDALKPRNHTGKNIQKHLKKQHEIRLGKAVRQRAILQVASMGELDPRSPLDKKLTGRKNVRPLMKKTG